jgi:hypothetical protein
MKHSMNTYSRMKMSLKARKKHAKSTKKTLHSPGDMILSDSDADADLDSFDVDKDDCNTPSPNANKVRIGSDQEKAFDIEDKKLNVNNEAVIDNIDDYEDDLVIIDVCCHQQVFQSVVNEFKSVENYSFAVAIEGANKDSDDKERNVISLDKGSIHGISFCFEDKMQAYYVCLKEGKWNDKELNISCYNPEVDKRISFEEKIKFLR